MLNVVNFGGGSYVLYAEVQGDTIEVDPEPYGDNFARPARLLPLEAKALAAAIDLVGEHLPEGSLHVRAGEDRRRARPRPRHRRPPDHHREGRRLGDRPRGERRDRRAQAAGDRALQGGRGRVHLTHDRALPADQRHRGLVRALLRAGEGRDPLVPPRPHPLRHRARRDLRAARGRGARDGRAGPPPARCRTSETARVWISPERARWAQRGPPRGARS